MRQKQITNSCAQALSNNLPSVEGACRDYLRSSDSQIPRNIHSSVVRYAKMCNSTVLLKRKKIRGSQEWSRCIAELRKVQYDAVPATALVENT